MKFLVVEKISEHRYKDNSGYLICLDCICSRTGKQTYTRDECFGDGDQTEIEVDRKEDDVFAPEALASFENKPITIEHPSVDVTPENYKDFSVGYVRDIHKGDYEGKPVMLACAVITDPKAIELVESGKLTNLSCGYDCDVEDVENPCQKNIRGNHIALCEVPRAGITHIQDSKEKNVKDSVIKNVHKEDITYEGESEPDIAWLQNAYNVVISYDGDSNKTYTIKGNEKDIAKFARDHHLTMDSKQAKKDDEPLHVKSLREQVSKNDDYRAMAELASKGDKKLFDMYFYAFKDAYEQKGYKPTFDDIRGKLRDYFYQEMDSYQDRNGLTDKEMGDYGMWDFEEEIGITEDDFVANGMQARMKHEYNKRKQAKNVDSKKKARNRQMKKDAKNYTKLSLTKTKNDYGEYCVKCYVDGKFSEIDSYLTDDWQDAVDTFNAMANRLGLKPNKVVMRNYYTATKETADSKNKCDEKETLKGIDNWIIEQVEDFLYDVKAKHAPAKKEEIIDYIFSLSDDITKAQAFRVYNYVRNKFDNSNYFDDSKKTKDTRWVNTDVRKGSQREQALRQYLDDNGFYYEPSSDGDYVHFEIKVTNSQQVEDLRDYLNQIRTQDNKSKRLMKKRCDGKRKLLARKERDTALNGVAEVIYDIEVKAETQLEKKTIIKWCEDNDVAYEVNDFNIVIYFDTQEKKESFFKELMNNEDDKE